MRILLAGGGTGGHVYPALAVAKVLRSSYNAELLYMGSSDGLETRLVPEAGLPFVAIQAGKLRRYLAVRTFIDLGKVPVGISQALRHVARFRPQVIFTSGGYVSVPAGLAGAALRIPTLVHQQDVLPNLANRILTPLAQRISVSFADSLPYFPRHKTILLGNPVRDAILAQRHGDSGQAKRRFDLDPTRLVLLVTGGSQGARHLNEVLVTALPELLPSCQVIHVCGEANYAWTRGQTEHLTASGYQLYSYLDQEMPAALLAADVVLCRAGAATLSELALLGKAALLVPLPSQVGGSPQEVNAAALVKRGAARQIRDGALTVPTLLATLLPLLADRVACQRLSDEIAKLAQPDAAERIAATLLELAGLSGGQSESRKALTTF